MFVALSSTLMLLPNAENAIGYGFSIVCVQTNVSNTKSANAVPTLPGATWTLSNSGAALLFLTAIVRYPVVLTVALTFGTLTLICAARARTFALADTVVVVTTVQYDVFVIAVSAGTAPAAT